jgi:hypothetical protein
MLGRQIAGAFVALAIASGSVFACEGDEIFADDFADPVFSADLWSKGDWITVGKGYLEIKNKPRFSAFAAIPSGSTEFDVCADVTYPEAKNPDGGTTGGFIFWFKDWDNHYTITTTPVGGLGVFRNAKGKSTAVSAPFKIYNQLKKGAGSVNTLRATLKGTSGTVYANGQKVTVFRAVAADEKAAGTGIALYGSSEQDQENAWRFGNVKLTEPK